MSRLDWDGWAMGIALAVAGRGDCTRRPVGCVIIGVKHEIISIGYNGVAPGRPGCLDGACPRGHMTYEQQPTGGDYSDCIATHAEMNALIRADHERLLGATMYVTCQPCHNCTKVAANTPLCQITYLDSRANMVSMFSDIQEWTRKER